MLASERRCWSVVNALQLVLFLEVSPASPAGARHHPEHIDNNTVHRRLQVARPKSYFVEVSSGTCEMAGHTPIEDGPECKQAAELWGVKITWGPNGGYHDVVDGCS